MLKNSKELFSEEIEQNILGCLIIFEETKKYINQIDEEDFYILKNKEIFKIIKSLEEQKKPINILSIKENARTKNMNEEKIFKYAIKITEMIITSAEIEYHICQLKNYSIRRKIVEKSRKIIDEMYKFDSAEEPLQIKKKATDEIQKIKIEDTEIEKHNMKNVIIESMKDIEQKYRKRDDKRYMTGFFDLDKITNGLHEQEFTIIAARPGCGKTSFALNIARNISKKGIYTYFVSLEMSEKQLGNRLISSDSKIDSHKLRSGWLEDTDFEQIGEVIVELSELKMIIDDKSKTIQDIESRAMELKETKNIGLIIIDYLQLLKSKNSNSIREQEVAEISRKLKLMSKDFDIPVVALCQLNRETEKRKRPILADLRESGSLEQDADNVIFLYIAEEEKVKQTNMQVETIVAKQRNGPTGTIYLKFNKKTMTFQNRE